MKKKRNRPPALVIIIVAAILTGGCATMQTDMKSLYSSGLLQIKAFGALKLGKYDQAIQCYKEILAAEPDNVKALKNIGSAYIRLRQGAEAAEYLERARGLDQQDLEIVILLGTAYALVPDYRKAVETLKIHAQREPDSATTDRINRQLTVFLHKEAELAARKAVLQEKELAAAPLNPSTVAVTYFGDMGLTERIKPLQKALAAIIITDLSNVPSLTVVERVKLQKLLEEMKMGSAGIVDANTAPKVGRLLGAGKIVTGVMLGTDAKSMRIDSMVSSTAPIQHLGKQDAIGLVDEFFMLEKAIVFALLRDMKISLSSEEKEIINKFATKSYNALRYYGEGLNAQDQGDWDEAIRFFKLSAEADPDGPGAKALAAAPTSEQARTDTVAFMDQVQTATAPGKSASTAATQTPASSFDSLGDIGGGGGGGGY
ncbi:MAG: tetratricopeptide repeat protein [Deltaproteobacteria bacterium]|nr:tetratricopeptide repeat protein [Deltaproteobacteria bacterium]